MKLRKSYPTTHILYVTYTLHTVYTVCNVHKLFQQGKKYHKVPNQGLNHPNKPFLTMIKPYLVIILVEVAFQSSDLAVLFFSGQLHLLFLCDQYLCIDDSTGTTDNLIHNTGLILKVTDKNHGHAWSGMVEQGFTLTIERTTKKWHMKPF